jgi:antitoxin HicB
MFFTYRLEPNGQGGFVIIFDDVAEAISEGVTEREAIENGQDALEVALLGRMKDGEALPAPSNLQPGASQLGVSAQAAAKLAFYEAFKASGLSRLALARKLGKDEAEVRRMLDPYHATKLPALEQGIGALGHRLRVVLEPA